MYSCILVHVHVTCDDDLCPVYKLILIHYKYSYYYYYCIQINSVTPSSYCWTPHSSMYIGCQGGQLLIADCDLGTTKVLSNPSLTKVSDIV